MKREFKFRITYQYEDTGIVTQRFIELGQPIPDLGERWSVIGKDQFAGLNDKNGKEIYEGDVIQYEAWTDFRNKMELDTFVVKYSNYGFEPFIWNTVVEDAFYNYELENFEIIGNIYENQELLK